MAQTRAVSSPSSGGLPASVSEMLDSHQERSQYAVSFWKPARSETVPRHLVFWGKPRASP